MKCTLISHFVWGGKRARIKLTTLQRSKLTGGLTVPNLDFYYYAFQIRSLQVLRHQDSQVPWRAIEAAHVKPHRLEDLPYTGTGRKNVQLRYGSIIVNSLNVWRKTEKTRDVTRVLHKTSLLWNNFHFQSGGKPFVFRPWAHKGVAVFGDLFDNTALRTFLGIKTDFDLPGTSYFLYLRLRSTMKAYSVPWDQPIPEHPMENWHNSRSLAIERVWERDLNTLSPEPLWENIWENLSSSSEKLSHQLIHFKLIHRAYANPLKCFKMKLIKSPNCTHCPDQALGATMDMFWRCAPQLDTLMSCIVSYCCFMCSMQTMNCVNLQVFSNKKH